MTPSVAITPKRSSSIVSNTQEQINNEATPIKIENYTPKPFLLKKQTILEEKKIL